MARTKIDFTKGLTKAEVVSRNDGGHNSLWVSVLAELATGVANGEGEYDTLYLIGEFGNASGARTTIRNLSKRTDLPGEFEMDSVTIDVKDDDGNLVYETVQVAVKDDDGEPVIGDDGEPVTEPKQVVKRTSELWAAVVNPERAADEDADVEPEGDEDEDEDEDEAPTTRRRSRKSAA